MRTRLCLVILGVIALECVIGLLVAFYRLNWPWTGFGPETSEFKQHAQTFLDWLDLLVLLAMLVVVGIATVWVTVRQRKASGAAHERQRETELQIATDNQREAALQGYIDRIAELLLHEHLRESSPKDEVRKIARVRTLTLLRGLDAMRKACVLQFLYESGLIEKGKCIIDLGGADLRSADLRSANLSGTDLGEVDLRYADLGGADLSYADLGEADLRSADLSGADLSGANLSRADLSRTKVTTEQLTTANSLEGTTMLGGRKPLP